MMRFRPTLAAAAIVLAPSLCIGETTEFCLEGELNLGARYQGMSQSNENYPARWCVITEDDSDRVLLSMQGRSNPDMEGAWRVAFIPPDLVRIVNADSPPDVEFRTPKSVGEAQRTRRMDPRRITRKTAAGVSPNFLGNTPRVHAARPLCFANALGRAELDVRR